MTNLGDAAFSVYYQKQQYKEKIAQPRYTHLFI